MERLLNLWFARGGASFLGDSICRIATARIEKYRKRGYRVSGMKPPNIWCWTTPPWMWSNFGKFNKVAEDKVAATIQNKEST